MTKRHVGERTPDPWYAERERNKRTQLHIEIAMLLVVLGVIAAVVWFGDVPLTATYETTTTCRADDRGQMVCVTTHPGIRFSD